MNNSLRKLTAGLTALMVMATMTSVAAFAENGVDIKDLFDHPQIYEAVKTKALDQDGDADILTWEEAQTVTKLDISGLGIISLEGIQCLHNLEKLNASDNNIQDIRFLSSLENLTEVDLSNNDIEDAAPISAMKAIKILNMSGNQIEETGPFNLAKTLEELDLSDNAIKDAGGIGELTGLTSLNLANNDIEDTGAVQNLTALTTLDLSGNEIRDLGGLSNLTSVETLKLSGNRIEDVTPLSKMDKLKDLNLNNNKLDADHLRNTLPSSFTSGSGFESWLEATVGSNDETIDNTTPSTPSTPSTSTKNRSGGSGESELTRQRREEVNRLWKSTRNALRDAAAGDVITAEADEADNVPTYVLLPLYGRDVTLVVNHDGDSYTLTDDSIGTISANQVYFTFEAVAEFDAGEEAAE